LAVLVPHANSIPDVDTAKQGQETKTPSHKWNPKKFKEKMKAKFQSKVRGFISFDIMNNWTCMWEISDLVAANQ
jgi:hypothetical protein